MNGEINTPRFNAYGAPRDDKHNLEEEIRFLATSITLKKQDLERTQVLHENAVHRLHALGNRAMRDMEREG